VPPDPDNNDSNDNDVVSLASTFVASKIGRHAIPPSFCPSHGGATVQYRRHRLMQHVQGIQNHWTPPLGNYSLSIAPAAARATINKTTMIQCITFC